MTEIRFSLPAFFSPDGVRTMADVVLAGLLAIVLVFAGLKLLHVGGRSAITIGGGCICFFSRLYQAALGLVFASAILLALYFYFTTEETRATLHEQASVAVPLVSHVVSNVHSGAKQALQSEVVAQGARHVKYIAERVLAHAEQQ